MCFLSVYRLKYLISLGIVITLLIGISLLYVLVYSFIISSITIQVQTDYRTVLISIFLSTSLLMIFSSLSGIYGLIRKKNKYVAFYAITMGIYMISFLILGIGTAVTPQFITEQCQVNQSTSYQITFVAGNQMLCKSNCSCFYTNTKGYSPQELNSMGIVNFNSDDNTLPINAQNCPSWSNQTYPLTSQIQWLQMFFNCSGWCQPNSNPPYYVFSNINFGVPNYGACAQSVSNFLYTFGHIILIASFTVSTFIFLILIVICCLWLHPDRGLKYDSLQLFKRTLLFVSQNKMSNDSSFTSGE